MPPGAFQQEPAAAAAATLWPENARPVALFAALSTQWRMGPAGPVGLDYGALPALPEWQRLAPRGRTRCMAALRTLEAEALSIFSEQSSRGAQRR